MLSGDASLEELNQFGGECAKVHEDALIHFEQLEIILAQVQAVEEVGVVL